MPRRPPRPAPRASTRQLAGWVALAAALIAAAVAVLPLQPAFLSLVIDDSFGATLHYEAATRQSAGTHLISTYGPLGFGFYPLYLPQTFRWLVILQAGFGAVLCWALAWLGWAAWGSPWGAALAVAGSASFLGAPDVRFWMLSLLAVLVELPRGRSAPASLRAALGAAIGLAGLVKITFLTAAVVALGPLTISDLLVHRRAPLPALAAAIAMVIAWLGLGLGWADWLAYLDWSMREITPGYSAAMQLPSTTGLVAHAVGVTIAVLVAGALLARQRTRRSWWMLALAMAGLLFALFKAGFVRADVHVFITVFGLLAGATLLAVLWAPPLRRTALGMLLVAVAPGSLLWHAIVFRGTAPTSILFAAVYPVDVVSRLRALPGLLFGDSLTQEHERHLAQLQKALALRRVPGSIDIYPYHQSLLLGSAVEFRPRPVFQSYMTYTPRLAHANADFLDSDHAPKWILFMPATIDGRFPALDDAPAWPILFTRYRANGVAGTFTVLERLDTPVPWHLTALGRVETQTDTAITVPPGLVWARIDLHETPADRIVATLFTAPYTYMDVVFADGTPWRYRLLPAIARDGFLLSPLISSAQDVAALMQSGTNPQPSRAITELRIHVDTPLGDPSGPRRVDVEFSQLQFGG